MMIALTPRIPICRTAQYFNPHFREGSDGQEYTVKGILMLFQSTLPQGKWRGGSRKGKSWCNFNPHFRKGSDVDRMDMPEALGNFNPHFRKGSDGISIYANALDEVFQSTLPQGKWPGAWRHGRAERISIHTSAREVTVFTERSVTDEIDFNPHFRKGSDSPAAVFAVFTGYFNPHFRKGSDDGSKKSDGLQINFNPHFRKGSDKRQCYFYRRV